jgi:hypothetical protein
MSQFQHKTLDSLSEQIRLIQLLPRRWDASPSLEDETASPLANPSTPPEAYATESAPIKCTIHHVWLHDKQNPKPEFTALSYTWGVSARNDRIMINDAPFQVTESLAGMLRHIQSSTETLTLWVDQLCIDQTNTNEKSAQVPLMKEIYPEAIQTIVWLGPAEKESDAIMDFLADVGKEAYEFGLMEIKLAELQNWSDDNEQNERLRNIKNDLNILLEKIGDTFPLEPFASLIARPWFYRVWVVQEVSLGSDVVFKCGEKMISYDHLRAAVFFHVFYNWNMMKDPQFLNPMNLMRNLPILMALNAINVSPITNMLWARRKYQTQTAGKGESLYNLLKNHNVGVAKTTRLGATDPRDMVFGLLGLADDVAEMGIKADYNKTCVEVYTDLARKLIEHGHIDTLALSQDPKSLPPDKGVYLPSWVPDWSGSIQKQSGETPEKGTPFRAHGTTRVSIIKIDQLGDSRGILGLQGARVDEVEKVGTVLTLPTAEGQNLGSERYVFLEEIDNFCQESARKIDGFYTDPQRRAEAAWRVPIGDREWDRGLTSGYPFTGRATAKSRQGYEAIRKWLTRLQLLRELGGETMLQMVNQEGAGSQHLESLPTSSFHTLAAASKLNGVESLDKMGIMQNADTMSYMTMMDDQNNRRPFLSVKGYLGLGPAGLEPGDIICILFGAKVPYFLRSRVNGGFTLVGEAYCDGIMDGEFTEQDPAPESFMIL